MASWTWMYSMHDCIDCHTYWQPRITPETVEVICESCGRVQPVQQESALWRDIRLQQEARGGRDYFEGIDWDHLARVFSGRR